MWEREGESGREHELKGNKLYHRQELLSTIIFIIILLFRALWEEYLD
jgi:hypothetical protein